MWTGKTDQTEEMPRLIYVFSGSIGHFVGFAMLWLKCSFSECYQIHTLGYQQFSYPASTPAITKNIKEMTDGKETLNSLKSG